LRVIWENGWPIPEQKAVSREGRHELATVQSCRCLQAAAKPQ
jgi:hypothetical protein